MRALSDHRIHAPVNQERTGIWRESMSYQDDPLLKPRLLQRARYAI